MSGIYGIINLKGNPVEKEQMDKMEALMIHRGVDGKAQWIDNNVGLGHLKLEITPESEYETLPLRYKQWVITADCRIDNREELDEPLSISEEERPFTPDSTYIVKAYEKWGKDCVQHLIGDFAFAIWDTVEQSLFCARDHIGIKPFFYVKTEDKLVFASEVKTVVEQREVPIELNERKVGEYLYYIHSFYHPNETFFINIVRLLPAHYLYLKDNTLELKRYWELKRKKEIKLENDEAYAEKLRELLFKAVECRMRTKHPIGVTLSGGLDSSTVACIAARKLAKEGKKIYAASSVLPENWEGIEVDEREYICAVIEKEKNIDIEYVLGTNNDFIDNIDNTFNSFYSICNPFYHIDDQLAESLKKKGNIRVKISGLGGDSTASINASPVSFLLLKNFAFFKAFQQIKIRAIYRKKTILETIYRELFLPMAILFKEKIGFRSKKKYIESNFLKENFNKKYTLFSNKINYKKFLRKIHFHQTIDEGVKILVFSLEEVNIRNNFWGIEDVIPLLDKRLLEYLVNVPIEKFEYKGWNRGLIRFAMNDYLPDKIQWRTTKDVFSPSYNRMLISNQEYLENYFNESNFKILDKYFNIDFLKTLLKNTSIYVKWNHHSFNMNGVYFGLFFIVCNFVINIDKKNENEVNEKNVVTS